MQTKLPIEDVNHEDMSLSELADFIVHHPRLSILFKAILHKMVIYDWEGTQQLINETIVNHPKVDDAKSVLLDMLIKSQN